MEASLSLLGLPSIEIFVQRKCEVPTYPLFGSRYSKLAFSFFNIFEVPFAIL